MSGIEGRIAVVTGAASGIGVAVAELFAERGARVVGVDRSEAVRDAVAALPGTGHHAIVADLTAAGAADAVAAETAETAGGIDILVNSAGIVRLAPALELSDADWDATLAVNLTAAFRMARAAGRVMTAAGRGRVVTIASQAALIALDEHVAYGASKAAILGMTKVLAREWAPSGVTVNAISPTVVATPLGEQAWAGEKGEAMKALIPVGRFAQPREIAALIAYLADDDAAMITGENVVIDGGYSIV
ncbi:GolD/DthD family dehydrogenase [Pseudolysinimonas sp.]|uniref:GolD/DthD family dehydrogenase n=1 Tax=Pseudolysinimonas sp. TaxID=2680009 RepID=UPI003F8039C9